MSLLLRGGHQDDLAWAISHVRNELGVKNNIKKPQTAKRVKAALTMLLERLKTMKKIPPTGCALYAGVAHEPGETKSVRVMEMVVPTAPMPLKQYLCDKHFATESVVPFLATGGAKTGICVIDGAGALCVVLQDRQRHIMNRRTMSGWSSSTRRGGQSAPRFQRLRAEQEQKYITVVLEDMKRSFVRDDGTSDIEALILAGKGDKKDELRARLELELPVIHRNLIATVTTAHGGEEGLQQAINQAAPALKGCALAQELAAVKSIFDRVHGGDDCVAYGVADTVRALTLGLVDTFVVWDQHPGRVVLSHDRSDVLRVLPAGTEGQSLLQWVSEEHAALGSELELVSNMSEDGAMFVRQLGGIAATLRFAMPEVDLDGMDDGDVEGIAEMGCIAVPEMKDGRIVEGTVGEHGAFSHAASEVLCEDDLGWGTDPVPVFTPTPGRLEDELDWEGTVDTAGGMAMASGMNPFASPFIPSSLPKPEAARSTTAF